MNDLKLPKAIYYIVGSRRPRPYVNKGHLKLALKGRFVYELKSVRIYVCYPDGYHGLPSGWMDVTDWFLDEDGGPTW